MVFHCHYLISSILQFYDNRYAQAIYSSAHELAYLYDLINYFINAGRHQGLTFRSHRFVLESVVQLETDLATAVVAGDHFVVLHDLTALIEKILGLQSG